MNSCLDNRILTPQANIVKRFLLKKDVHGDCILSNKQTSLNALTRDKNAWFFELDALREPISDRDFIQHAANSFGVVAIELFPFAMSIAGRSVIGVNRGNMEMRKGPSIPAMFRMAVIARPGDVVPANGARRTKIFWNEDGEYYVQGPNRRVQRLVSLAQLASVFGELAAGAEVQA